ncbi:MAG: nucleotidyltransferase family protein, partial [Lachnospiraceae bacterium]|nr:nucleotidyltransferase family protein [Lachnospiraceae bacterium]
MKTAAVICELNPFHNGHAYLMKKLREESGADYIIALMSGNYVQRGEPAVFEKYTRAKMALSGSSGAYADLVLEMPALFSTASAREFAAAGVRMALLSGVADCIGFGTEGSADTAGLERQAAFLEAAENSSDPSFSALVKAALKAGKTYPEALASAGFSINGSEASVHPDLTSTGPEASVSSGSDAASRAADISAPNNILAAEYLRALKRFDPEHSIRPYSISRVGDGYSSTEAEDPHFCSAGSLRKILLDQGSVSERRDLFLQDHVPPAALLEYQSSPPLHPDAFSPYRNKALLEAKYRHQDLSVCADV